jgi:RHS repeat-associated protein
VGAPRRRLSRSTYNTPVIFRCGGSWRTLGAAIVVLVGVLSPARAVASLPSYSDAHADELAVIAPLPELSPPEALPAPDIFDVRPKTRVRGFEVGLHCSIGGDDGLTCGSRRAYRAPYDGNASDISVFTGYVYSPLLNLYYAKARFYDPETARFTSQDSYLGQADDPPSLHRYVYVRSAPTRYTDPSGHCEGDETCALLYANATPEEKAEIREQGELFLTPARVVKNFLVHVGEVTRDMIAADIYNAWDGYPTMQEPFKPYAERHWARDEPFREAIRTPENLKNATIRTMAAPVDQIVEGYESGNGVQMTQGITGVTLSVVGTRTSQLPSFSFRPPPGSFVLSTGEVVSATGELVMSSPGGGVPMGQFLSKNSSDGGVVKEGPDGKPAVEPATKKGGAKAVQAGQQGEKVGTQVSGLPKNTRRIPSASGRRAYRVPDHMTEDERFIQEDKAVNEQYLSSQLLDDKAHVARGGQPGRVDVLIDETTKITTPLLREHLNPGSPLKLKVDRLKDIETAGE